MSVPSNVTSTPSLSTRASVWLKSMPIVTRVIFLICSSIYVLELIFGWIHGEICEQPILVIFKFEIWRLYTNAWFHVGILHIALNMMSFLPMGTTIERAIGSFSFFYLVNIFCFLIGLVHTFIAAFSNYILQYSDFMKECGIGFSGVIFGLLVIQSLQTNSNQSVFGFFSVKSHLYPWVLLVLIQIIMPGVSFLGHLSGILVGYAYVYGFLNYLLLKPETLNRIESSRLLGFIIMRDGYISNPSLGSNAFQPQTRNSQSGLLSSVLPIFNNAAQTTQQPARPANQIITPSAPPATPPNEPKFPGTGYTLASN